MTSAARARVVLRQLLGGPVSLERGKKPGSLFAVFSLRRQALLEGRTSSGSGGPLCDVPPIAQSARLK
jgi:hypothetical protein